MAEDDFADRLHDELARPTLLAYYDRDGMPISQQRWAALHADPDYVMLRRTTIFDAADPAPNKHVDVSTVWIGMTVNLELPDVPELLTAHAPTEPMLFETIAFGIPRTVQLSGRDIEVAESNEERRYHTEAEALEGHTRIVIEQSAGMREPIVTDTMERT